MTDATTIALMGAANHMDIWAELRALLASSRGALDDLANEVQIFTSLDRTTREGSSRALVRAAAETLQILLLGAQHRAMGETRSTVPSTMPMQDRAAQDQRLRQLSRDITHAIASVERLSTIACAKRFKPRERRLQACELVTSLCAELRLIGRNLSAIRRGS